MNQIQKLTTQEIEIARYYLICRTAIKVLSKDRSKLLEMKPELLGFYIKFIDRVIKDANNKLQRLSTYPLEISPTSQPTLYELKVGKRMGYFEMKPTELQQAIASMFGIQTKHLIKTEREINEREKNTF